MPDPQTRDFGHTIENEFLRVEADAETGLLTVVDRETGWVLRGCSRFVDGGDRGDEYNYCCPENDRLVQAAAGLPVVHRQVDALGERLTVEMVYQVPKALDEADRSARSGETVELPITVRVELSSGVRRVDFEASVENHARDHRLRVHFPVPVTADSAYAEGHWDVVEWPLDLPAETEGWVEQPAPTHPHRGWATISDGRRGVTVANRGLPEVEVLRTEGGAEIALTLLRCVGWLSRDDLHCRQGHAGPGLPVPEAQCRGSHTFRYALFSHLGDWREAFARAESFQTDLRAVATGVHPGSLPPVVSFVRVEPAALQVSAIKAPEQGDGLILRLWNVEDRPTQGTVRLWRPFLRAVRVDLSERELEELDCGQGMVALSLRPREVVTLRLFL